MHMPPCKKWVTCMCVNFHYDWKRAKRGTLETNMYEYGDERPRVAISGDTLFFFLSFICGNLLRQNISKCSKYSGEELRAYFQLVFGLFLFLVPMGMDLTLLAFRIIAHTHSDSHDQVQPLIPIYLRVHTKRNLQSSFKNGIGWLFLVSSPQTIFYHCAARNNKGSLATYTYIFNLH